MTRIIYRVLLSAAVFACAACAPAQTGDAATSGSETASVSGAPSSGGMRMQSENPSFLPSIHVTDTSAPKVTRNGIEIPLRPEMLEEKTIALKVPKVQQTTLTSGIKLFHYASHDLPSVHFTVMINAGRNFEPVDKIGLAEITVKTLRSGGTESRSGDDIDRELEQIGSDLEVGAEREFIQLQMFALSENKEKALALLAEILTRPAFDTKKLEQQKDLRIEEIRRENDQPADIARREFRKLIYGPESPLARTPKANHIARITQQDVRSFYDDFYRPSSMWVGVSGDISEQEAKQMVEAAFEGWSKPPAQLPPPVTVDESRDAEGGVFFIRKQTAQSQIRLGHYGMMRRAPEQYAVNVLNNVYGAGGFSSRLMQQVRTKKGYVYGVGGAVQSDDPIGVFAAVASSKTKTTAAAVEEMLNVTKDLLTGNITEEEIDVAKRDVVYSFITNFDVPKDIVYQHMYYNFLNYPPDYLETFVDRINGVTLEETAAAARKYIRPDKLKIFVLGDEPGLDKPLSTFGVPQEVKLDPFEGPDPNPAGDQ